jgi:hypothetical protein
MPQSRTRSNRAAMRAKYRKPKRRRSGSFGWTVAIVAVVVVGVALLALQVSSNRNENDPGSGPPRAANTATGQPQDHWHTYLGVNICGQWLSPVPAFEEPVDAAVGTRPAGIHSHGDGLVHTHPYVQAEEGRNATLAKYADYGGWSVSSDSIDAWTGPNGRPGQRSWSDGDTCPFGQYKGEEGRVVWAVDGKPRTGNPADYHQLDGATIAIGFLPRGAELGFPPSACDAFANISDQNTAVVVTDDSPCRTQGTTTTTAPPATTPPPSEEPSTTVAPENSP